MEQGGDVRFNAIPTFALVDDRSRYTVEGLNSYQYVTIVCTITENKVTFISHAHFVANKSGFIDLSVDESVGGSYKGKEPMGLLWSMQPVRGTQKGVRLIKKDPTKLIDVHFTVLRGHINIQALSDVHDEAVLCEAYQARSYMGPGVKRIMIKQGRLRGALFVPAGDGPFPGVIDLFGTAGGLIQFRGALFASRGYITFCQAYFNYDDLPTEVMWNLECFDEAIDFMAAHPNVKRGRLGAVGVSKGAEMACYMALKSPLIKAVVCIGPCHYYTMSYMMEKGQQVAVGISALDSVIFDSEGIILKDMVWYAEIPDDAIIKIEEVKEAEFLFITGDDDVCIDTRHVDLMVSRLRARGRTNYRVCRYRGAGHLIEPPYMPSQRACYHPSVKAIVLFGGNMRDNAYAQEDSWREMLAFLKRKLIDEDQDVVVRSNI